MDNRVGILTLYYNNNNFGGLLQAFALQYSIESLGFSAEQICFDFKKKKSFVTNINSKKSVKKIKFKSIVRKLIKVKIKLDKRKMNRVNHFTAFQNSIPHSSNIYDVDSITSSLDIYDVFICGSDQIWNDWGLGEKVMGIYTLDFVPQNKYKFSYAASSGSKEALLKNEAILSKGIKGLNEISVREKEIKEMVERISGKEVRVVLDPVFLLTADEWDKVTSFAAPKTKRKYALCYFLGTSKEQRITAERMAHKMGLQTIVFPYIELECVEDAFWGDVRDFDSGPAEFVQLIKNADYVMTDSFHATVFSVIFQKNFYVFKRETRIAGSKMNNRLYDFLSNIGFTDRMLPDNKAKPQNIMKADYTEAQNIIDRCREQSLRYLEGALSHGITKGADSTSNA